MTNIKVGDRVCYSRKFLQSTGQVAGEVPFMRGVVQAISTPYSAVNDNLLATVEWGEGYTCKVLTANLAKITETQGIIDPA